jgi:hypothetical protein
MTSGSMLIPNYLGERTLLKILGKQASSDAEDHALEDAKAQLAREKRNPSPSEGNIKFLTAWIDLYNNANSVAVLNPNEKTSTKSNNPLKSPLKSKTLTQTPTALTPVIQQSFNMKWLGSLPEELWQLFGVYNNNGIMSVYFPLSYDKQLALFESLAANPNYASKMIVSIMAEQQDPCLTFLQLQQEGFKGIPSYGMIPLGESGQYALPGDTTPQPGSLGPYPTIPPLPTGWIGIPDIELLLVPNANVPVLLQLMFPLSKPVPVTPKPKE